MRTTLLVCLLLAQDGATPPSLPAPFPEAAAEAQSLPPAASESSLSQSQERISVPRNLFLARYDRNGDGVLSPDELPRFLAKRFAQADRNQDGVLDADEILHAENRIGRRARGQEDLKLERSGELAPRPAGRSNPVPEAIVRVLRQLDFNQDGYVDSGEVGSVIRDPQFMLAQGLSALQNGGEPAPADEAQPPAEPIEPATSKGPLELVPAPRPEDVAAPPADPRGPARAQSPPSNSGPAAPASKRRKDDLPGAAEIIQALDNNQNGMVDRDEAVDKLADNFRMLDKDGNGGIDLAELERGLRLARMFGIKPNYTSRKPVAPEPATPAKKEPAAPPARRGLL